jgi:hypothetical protein
VVPRLPRRDLIVRIDGNVRFARLADCTIADAIWGQLPCYGLAERTREGLLALAVEIPAQLTSPGTGTRQTATGLAYCLLTRRVVFPSARPTATASTLIAWAHFAEPYPSHTVDAVPHGARVSLLHADS